MFYIKIKDVVHSGREYYKVLFYQYATGSNFHQGDTMSTSLKS